MKKIIQLFILLIIFGSKVMGQYPNIPQCSCVHPQMVVGYLRDNNGFNVLMQSGANLTNSILTTNTVTLPSNYLVATSHFVLVYDELANTGGPAQRLLRLEINGNIVPAESIFSSGTNTNLYTLGSGLKEIYFSALTLHAGTNNIYVYADNCNGVFPGCVIFNVNVIVPVQPPPFSATIYPQCEQIGLSKNTGKILFPMSFSAAAPAVTAIQIIQNNTTVAAWNSSSAWPVGNYSIKFMNGTTEVYPTGASNTYTYNFDGSLCPLPTVAATITPICQSGNTGNTNFKINFTTAPDPNTLIQVYKSGQTVAGLQSPTNGFVANTDYFVVPFVDDAGLSVGNYTIKFLIPTYNQSYQEMLPVGSTTSYTYNYTGTNCPIAFAATVTPICQLGANQTNTGNINFKINFSTLPPPATKILIQNNPQGMMLQPPTNGFATNTDYYATPLTAAGFTPGTFTVKYMLGGLREVFPAGTTTNYIYTYTGATCPLPPPPFTATITPVCQTTSGANNGNTNFKINFATAPAPSTQIQVINSGQVVATLVPPTNGFVANTDYYATPLTAAGFTVGIYNLKYMIGTTEIFPTGTTSTYSYNYTGTNCPVPFTATITPVCQTTSGANNGNTNFKINFATAPAPSTQIQVIKGVQVVATLPPPTNGFVANTDYYATPLTAAGFTVGIYNLKYMIGTTEIFPTGTTSTYSYNYTGTNCPVPPPPFAATITPVCQTTSGANNGNTNFKINFATAPAPSTQIQVIKGAQVVATLAPPTNGFVANIDYYATPLTAAGFTVGIYNLKYMIGTTEIFPTGTTSSYSYNYTGTNCPVPPPTIAATITPFCQTQPGDGTGRRSRTQNGNTNFRIMFTIAPPAGTLIQITKNGQLFVTVPTPTNGFVPNTIYNVVDINNIGLLAATYNVKFMNGNNELFLNGTTSSYTYTYNNSCPITY